MARLKLAVIGCGAQTSTHHLPVISRSRLSDVAVLVDKILPTARQLADAYNVPLAVNDHREIFDKVDAAIVVLPNHLHAPVTIDLLQHGIHVLVEKPMALTVKDCDRMIEAARVRGALLAVGLDFRFLNSSRFIKKAMEANLLGDIVKFTVRQGHNPARWPLASDYVLRKETGGGVLADVGAHILDLLLWWLGDYETFEYYDDALAGVEANCEVHLRLRCGASGIVELSRTRELKNSITIEGERGALEVGFNLAPLVHLKVKGQELVLSGDVLRSGVKTNLWDAFHLQLEDFVNAVLTKGEPFVSGYEGKRAVELIEACYERRRPLNYPWSANGFLPQSNPSSL